MNKTRIYEHSVGGAPSLQQLVELGANKLIDHKACTSGYMLELLELVDELGVYASEAGVISLSLDYSDYVLIPHTEVIITIDDGLDLNNRLGGLVYLIRISTGEMGDANQ